MYGELGLFIDGTWRKNGGGNPAMVNLLCTYLFPPRQRKHLYDIRHRDPARLEQAWTLENLPGPSLADKDLYLLTSHGTFSAGEGFAYILQAEKRATVVGEVTASTFQSTYSLKDPGAQAGTNYYRLQQVDKDGHSSWSTISTVKLAASAGEISLYPNPVRGKTFFLKTPSTDAVILKIYTLSGQQLLISSLKGQTQYTVQLPVSLVSNTYLLVQVITNGRTQAFTVLEQ